MSATLPLARDAFIKSMSRDTTHGERPRMVAVLDAMIAWSVARPSLVRFRVDDNEKGIVRFEPVGSNAVLWAAIPRHRDGPMLELLPAASRILSDEERAEVIGKLGAHTRATLDPAGRLSISFSALKNNNARAAVLELLGELLAKTQAASRPTTKVS